MMIIDECSDCGGEFDSEECWEEDCFKVSHPQCLYSCEEGGCENFFCSEHAADHACSGD